MSSLCSLCNMGLIAVMLLSVCYYGSVYNIGITRRPTIANDPDLSFPLVPEQVPNWKLWVVCSALGGIFVAVQWLAFYGRGHRNIVLYCAIGLITVVFLSQAVTKTLQIMVGEPRPNFFAICNSTCDDDAYASFPSEHASLSFSVCVYTASMVAFLLSNHNHGIGIATTTLPNSLYIIQYVIAFGLCTLSGWISVSRIQDYRHRISDVLSGTALGTTVGYYVWKLTETHLKSLLWEEPLFPLM